MSLCTLGFETAGGRTKKAYASTDTMTSKGCSGLSIEALEFEIHGRRPHLLAGSEEGHNVAVPQVSEQRRLLHEALPLAGGRVLLHSLDGHRDVVLHAQQALEHLEGTRSLNLEP